MLLCCINFQFMKHFKKPENVSDSSRSRPSALYFCPTPRFCTIERLKDKLEVSLILVCNVVQSIPPTFHYRGRKLSCLVLGGYFLRSHFDPEEGNIMFHR
jgi:hypothetical protein